MFERFNESAHVVVRGAESRARAFGHRWVGTEHLLLALLDPASGSPATILHETGLRQDRVVAAIEDSVGKPVDRPMVLGRADAEALRSIGIDLDAVLAAVERSFGPGALRPPPPQVSGPRRRRRWHPKYGLRWLLGLHRRRRQRRLREAGPPVDAGPSEHLTFTPRSKRVLELSMREALRLRHKQVGSEHILLGLLCEGGGLALKLLVDAGLTLDDLRHRTLRALGDAA